MSRDRVQTPAASAESQEQETLDREESGDQVKASHLAHAQIQLRYGQGSSNGIETIREAAVEGTAGTPTTLPYHKQIQASFGHHDVGGIKAHVGGPTALATEKMGSEAFATGSSVGFAASPDVRTAAHEAAHVVQQRGGVQLKGGVGEPGDRYEQNADAVADRVVNRQSAEPLLDWTTDPTGATTSGSAKVQCAPPLAPRTSRPTVLRRPPRAPAPGRAPALRPRTSRPTVLRRPPGAPAPVPAPGGVPAPAPTPRGRRGAAPAIPLRNHERRVMAREEARRTGRVGRPPPPLPLRRREQLELDRAEARRMGRVGRPPEEEAPDVPEPDATEAPDAPDVIEPDADEGAEGAAGDGDAEATPAPFVHREVTNEKAKTRLEKGSHELEIVHGLLSQSERAWQRRVRVRRERAAEEAQRQAEAQAQADAAAAAAPPARRGLFAGLRDMFRSRPEAPPDAEPEPTPEPEASPDMAPEPLITHQYEQARGIVTAINDVITTEHIPEVEAALTAPPDSPEASLGEEKVTQAKEELWTGARVLKPRVEHFHVSQLKEIGEGIYNGKKGMLKRILKDREAQFSAFGEVNKIGAGGSDTIIWKGNYLDRIPLAFKLQKHRDYNSEADNSAIWGEEATTAQFSHPNVLATAGTSKRGPGYGYAMELAERGDLEKLFKKFDARNTPLATRINVMKFLMKGAFGALAHVHAKGFVHGDIKHQNFLLADDSSSKMMDFGETRREQREGDRDRGVGTPGFMAPEAEAIAGRTGVEKQSDIYSMGITMLHALFSKDDATSRVGHAGEKKAPTREEWLALMGPLLAGSPELAAFITKSLSINPQERMTAAEAEADPLWNDCDAEAAKTAIAIALEEIPDPAADADAVTVAGGAAGGEES